MTRTPNDFERLTGPKGLPYEIHDRLRHSHNPDLGLNEISRRADLRLDATRPSRELAIAWALEIRKHYEKGGV